jgi:hypothetical protein
LIGWGPAWAEARAGLNELGALLGKTDIGKASVRVQGSQGRT